MVVTYMWWIGREETEFHIRTYKILRLAGSTPPRFVYATIQFFYHKIYIYINIYLCVRHILGYPLFGVVERN